MQCPSYTAEVPEGALLGRRLTSLHDTAASNLKARVANRPYSQE